MNEANQVHVNRVPRRKRLDRRFGLPDAMTLVVASALALSLLRGRIEFVRTPATPSTYRTVVLILAVYNSFLIPFTLALLPIALRRPRPRLRATLRRPGLAACVAASGANLVLTARFAVKLVSFRATVPRAEAFRLEYLYPWLVGPFSRAGFAVVGAWLMLVMTGLWRAEPSWVDRAGRLLGAGWVAQPLLFVALPWAEPYLPAL